VYGNSEDSVGCDMVGREVGIPSNVNVGRTYPYLH
jgi:hypothetical protein